jgi:H+/Cl- antiporter ClcA
MSCLSRLLFVLGLGTSALLLGLVLLAFDMAVWLVMPMLSRSGIDDGVTRHSLSAVGVVTAVGAGVAGAAIAVIFTVTTLALRRVFGAIPPVVRPVVGGVVLATLALWSRYALTFGEGQTGHVLAVEVSAGVLAVAAVAKLLGTSVTVSSGWPGGFIIPLFFIGASLGQLTHHAIPDARVAVVCAGLMAAANVGVTKTLLGSTLVVTEMGGLQLLPTTLIAAVVSFMLTSEVGLIDSQRERAPLDEET